MNYVHAVAPAALVSIGLCVFVSSEGYAMARQDVWPSTVRTQLDRLLLDCREAGGRPTINPGAVTKAALTDDSFSDHIIWTEKIDCVGVYTVFGGAAGKTLVLVPASGKGIRQVPAHSWKLVGEAPMEIEIFGGFDCVMGHQDRCTNRLAWNGTAFDRVSGGLPVQKVNQVAGGRSIVGNWAETRDGCASPMAGMVRVGPKSLTTDEMSCSFTNVSRIGSSVTWTGSCDESGLKKRTTVTATENGGRLIIKFANGNTWAPLMRCSR